MTRVEFIRRFITVHKCTGCGEILDFEHSDSAFCDVCMLDFNAALNVGCKSCFKPARECTCMPRALESVGVLVHRKLFFYEKENYASSEMKLIFRMKETGYRRLADFSAERLESLVLEELDTLGADTDSLVITGVPRGKKNLREYGFDHTERLARSLSGRLGIKYARTLRTTLAARAQKTLGARQRARNAEKNIRLCRNTDVVGKYIILVDDMVTTGESMAVCVKRLSEGGARAVLCFSLASKNKM